MKKLSYLFVLITLCIFTQQMQAQPLFVNNNSNVNGNPYDITTYLIYSRTGEVCTEANWAVPLTFEAGAMLTINDGSFVWTSPWNNEHFCLSEAIGYGCDPVPLDFYGQRIEVVDYTADPTYGFSGGISTIAGVPCLGFQNAIGFPSSLNWEATLTPDYTVTIIDLDNNETMATINYMNWGFMQTLAFN